MIDEMRLRNLGVIADATLPLGPGFTAITGETGAGKTMVVTGLGLLLGQRADSGIVRHGAPQASVAGVWVIPDSGIVAETVTEAGGELEPVGDGNGELYLSRVVSAEGRSRSSVGGHASPASVLAALADDLVVVHGQSGQLRLRSATAQREALDRFAGESVATIATAYAEAFDTSANLQRQITSIRESRDRRASDAATLRQQLAVIEQIDPQPGEDTALAARAERLGNAEELRHAARAAYNALAAEDAPTDAAALVAEARRTLERSNDPALLALAAQLADVGYRLADVSGELSRFLADIDESGPHELAAVTERQALLASLLREHGSLHEALELWRTGSLRLADLEDDDHRIRGLEERQLTEDSRRDELAAQLTAARTESAALLGERVSEELHALAMPDARLEVVVSPTVETRIGRDEVSFLLAPHSGADPRTITKGASGGELSRVMLAIEVVIAANDPVPTFVFDEVDAGIGGAAAIEVGRRLARLAETAQVIAVTHLAQVAAFATNHLSVVKASDGAVTESSVRRLEGAEREAEMARLLSGMSSSDAALRHARELLGLRN